MSNSFVGSPRPRADSQEQATARLARPLPTDADDTQSQQDTGAMTPPLVDHSYRPPIAESSTSAITSAINSSRQHSPFRGEGAPQPPPPSQLPPDQRQPPPAPLLVPPGTTPDISSGAFSSPRAFEDFEVVRRHLAGPHGSSPHLDGSSEGANNPTTTRSARASESRDQSPGALPDDDEFSSLRLQGGDITREIYRRTEAEHTQRRTKLQRSRSAIVPRIEPSDQTTDYDFIRQPGGFRRDHLRRVTGSPGPSSRGISESRPVAPLQQRSFITNNFYEFLSLYGHFAGEPLEDEEDDAASQAIVDDEEDGERRPLLRQRSTKKRNADKGPKSGTAGTVLILLKSFIGTGVMFLPRAFHNGGMLFSFLTLILVSALSYYCFLLLTTSRLTLKGSYADMGEMTYGRFMRTMINASLVVSQMGFASAYIVFTSENLQAFVLAVTDCRVEIDIKVMILLQLVIFMPLSLYRNLNNISIIVYIADVFIVLGLVYLYYYGISTIVQHGGVADITLLNTQTWTLFIGTAIFTFEGIGLLIPIQDGMKKPEKLPGILGGVMVINTFVFVSMGALLYAAYGSKTETVIILNMDQENKFVNALQFLYSLAILLSTPVQIFPAITIMVCLGAVSVKMLKC